MIFFKKEKKINDKTSSWRTYWYAYTECVTCTQNSLCTPEWTTVVSGLHAILLADFHIVWKRNRSRWEDALDRVHWPQREQAQTQCWREMGAQYFFCDGHREFQTQNCGMGSWAGQMETCLQSMVDWKTSLSCSVITPSHSWRPQPHPGKRGRVEVQRGASRQVSNVFWFVLCLGKLFSFKGKYPIAEKEHTK